MTFDNCATLDSYIELGIIKDIEENAVESKEFKTEDRALQDNIWLYDKKDCSSESIQSNVYNEPNLKEQLDNIILNASEAKKLEPIFKDIALAYLKGHTTYKVRSVSRKDIDTILQLLAKKGFACNTKSVLFKKIEVSWQEENEVAMNTIRKYVVKYGLGEESLEKLYSDASKKLMAQAKLGERRAELNTSVSSAKNLKFIELQLKNRFAKEKLQVYLYIIDKGSYRKIVVSW